MLSTTKMKEEFEEETGVKVDDTETENKTYEVCTALYSCTQHYCQHNFICSGWQLLQLQHIKPNTNHEYVTL